MGGAGPQLAGIPTRDAQGFGGPRSTRAASRSACPRLPARSHDPRDEPGPRSPPPAHRGPLRAGSAVFAVCAIRVSSQTQPPGRAASRRAAHWSCCDCRALAAQRRDQVRERSANRPPLELNTRGCIASRIRTLQGSYALPSPGELNQEIGQRLIVLSRGDMFAPSELQPRGFQQAKIAPDRRRALPMAGTERGDGGVQRHRPSDSL